MLKNTKTEIVDYRRLRPGNINSPEFRHLWLLLFWAVFGIFFALVERGGVTKNFHLMYSPIDDLIPFCEIFLIPYLFWFVYLVGIHIYTLLFDVESFRKLMYFIMITYTVTMVIYFLYPTAQGLRPLEFERDNALTRFIAGFYQFDTNTNVCPSSHVIGSVAVSAAAWNSKHFSTRGWRIVFSLATILISISTVFIKQHSVIDVAAAIPICVVAYIIVYCGKRGKAER